MKLQSRLSQFSSSELRQIRGRGWRRTIALALLGAVALTSAGCHKQVATGNLQVGSCFNASAEILLEGRPPTQIETVSCRRSHNSEVVGVHTLDLNGTLTNEGTNGAQGESVPVNPTVSAEKTSPHSERAQQKSGAEKTATDPQEQAKQSLAQRAAELCRKDFRAYVGKDYQQTKWDLYPISTIKQRGNQTEQAVICVALTLPEQSQSIKQIQ